MSRKADEHGSSTSIWFSSEPHGLQNDWVTGLSKRTDLSALYPLNIYAKGVIVGGGGNISFMKSEGIVDIMFNLLLAFRLSTLHHK